MPVERGRPAGGGGAADIEDPAGRAQREVLDDDLGLGGPQRGVALQDRIDPGGPGRGEGEILCGRGGEDEGLRREGGGVQFTDHREQLRIVARFLGIGEDEIPHPRTHQFGGVGGHRTQNAGRDGMCWASGSARRPGSSPGCRATRSAVVVVLRDGALEPTTILATVAAATRHLGLIGTLSTTFNDPVELAERLLTLDHLSDGRAAWNAVTTYNPAAAGNFGLTTTPDQATRYRRAGEFVDAVLGLWRAAVAGRDFTHRGEFFDIAGRLPLAASPQGHPLIVQAGGSPQGRELAGRTANAVFTAEMTLGFNLMPDAFPQGLEIFVDEVVPILRRRGLFRYEYTERTLRERFGIGPVATHAAA